MTHPPSPHFQAQPLATATAERLTGRPMRHDDQDQARIGDHIWWVNDVSRFRSRYPEWSYRYDIAGIMADVHDGLVDRLGRSPS